MDWIKKGERMIRDIHQYKNKALSFFHELVMIRDEVLNFLCLLASFRCVIAKGFVLERDLWHKGVCWILIGRRCRRFSTLIGYLG